MKYVVVGKRVDVVVGKRVDESIILDVVIGSEALIHDQMAATLRMDNWRPVSAGFFWIKLAMGFSITVDGSRYSESCNLKPNKIRDEKLIYDRLFGYTGLIFGDAKEDNRVNKDRR